MRNSHKSFLLLSQHKGGPETWGLWNTTMPLGFTVIFQGSFCPLSVFHIDQVGPKPTCLAAAVLVTSLCCRRASAITPGLSHPWDNPTSGSCIKFSFVHQAGGSGTHPEGSKWERHYWCSSFQSKTPVQVKFLLLSLDKAPSPARGAFPGHKSQVAEPAAQSSATLHCVSIKSLSGNNLWFFYLIILHWDAYKWSAIQRQWPWPINLITNL